MTQLSFYFQKGRFNQGREFKNIWTGAVFQGQKENKDYISLPYNHLPRTRRRGFISSLIQSRWFVISGPSGIIGEQMMVLPKQS